MSFLTEKPFGIAYNFPIEYNALAAELWGRDIPLAFIDPAKLYFDPGNQDMNYSLLYNDLSAPSGFPFQAEFAQSLISYNRHLEITNLRFAQGRIINGSAALDILINRVRQISLFASLGVRFPKTIFAANLDALVAQVNGLKFPILVKSGDVTKSNTVFKFDSVHQLIDAIFEEKVLPDNNLILAQEYHQPKGDHIIRVDTLNGKFLAAHKVFTLREPSLSWVVEHKAEVFHPGDDVITAIEHIVRAARIDIGSVEFFLDRKTNEVYFYGVTPFNYRKSLDPSGQTISAVGNYVEKRLQKIREFELAL